MKSFARMMSVLMLLAAASIPAAAQVNLAWGAKAGAVISKVVTDPSSESLDNQTGLTAGAFVRWPITPIFGIQPEVLYTMKGGKDETGATFKLKLNYIDIPVLAHIHWTRGSIMPFV